MTTKEQRSDAVRKLGELIKDIRIAMLTTLDQDGNLHSRPMATQREPFDGDLWFFTRAHGGVSGEIEHDQRVNLAYASPSDNRYVSVTGRAELVHDPLKMRQLWNPLYKAYFDKGLDDPSLALLKVRVDHAELWDAPSSTVVHVLGMAKAAITGKPYQAGAHKQVDLNPGLH